jgi:integration host factor subunit alpha
MAIVKNDLIDKITAETGLSRKECLSVVDSILEIMKDDLSHGNSVMISGFGKWTVKNKGARRGRNPQTGEDLTISARRVVTFKPSTVLKDEINGGDR